MEVADFSGARLKIKVHHVDRESKGIKVKIGH
jgi:hypothetical protein